MPAVASIFSCLELLDELEQPLSLPEMARSLCLPESSLAATLRALVQLGYLHHDRSSRTYAPTMRLAELGGWVASRYALDPALRQAAATISQRVGENVVIAHRNDIRLQYLHFENAEKHAPVAKVGTTRLICHSGLGWALLSFMSNRAIHSIVRRTNAVLTSEDAVELASVMQVVEACRRTGHVRAEHTIRIGFGVIAMPLRFVRAELAIGVSAAAARVRDGEAEIVEIMRSTLAGVPGCSGVQ